MQCNATRDNLSTCSCSCSSPQLMEPWGGMSSVPLWRCRCEGKNTPGQGAPVFGDPLIHLLVRAVGVAGLDSESGP